MDLITLLYCIVGVQLAIIFSLVFKIVFLSNENSELRQEKEDLYKLYEALAKEIKGYMQEERL